MGKLTATSPIYDRELVDVGKMGYCSRQKRVRFALSYILASVDKTMTQNVYDRSDFFEGYSKLSRSTEGLDGAAEWPSMRALLPNLHDLNIVDLGCGFGWFCRWAVEQGVASALGIDVSENMLARARNATSNPRIDYVQQDLERLDLPLASFDLAYSSLALHYVANLAGLLFTLRRSLRPGGYLVMSIEHPIYMAPTRADWLFDERGRRTWPVDSYLVEGPRTTDWLVQGVIKQHRTIGTTLNHLIRCGFVVAHVEEWGPTDEQIATHPDWEEARDRPMSLLIAAQR